MTPRFNFIQFLCFGMASAAMGADQIGFVWFLVICGIVGFFGPLLNKKPEET